MKLKRTLSTLLAFVMLAGSALVSAPAFADTPLPFEDVKADAWYYDAVADVYEVGLMKGKTETKFDPTAPMSRAEFVTVLSRLAAINTGNYGYSDSLDFTDTDPEAWYADAAGWAVETGLTKGTSDTTFAPTREITRQEMAVLIVRFVKYLGETVPDNSKVEKFADSDKIASWATADIETMRKYGFIQGDQNGNFNPEGKADRASVATIAMRLLPFVTTTSIVKDGKSDYVIVADESLIEAAERIQYQTEYTTGASIDIVESSSAKKAIVLKTESDEKLGADGYEIKTNGETVTIIGNTPDGVYKGVSRFMLRATFDAEMKFTSAASDRYEFRYPIGKLTINGNDISKYTVYYPANASGNTLTAVEDIVKYIEMATGVKLPTSTGKPGSFGIIVDETTVVIDGSVNKSEDNFTVKSEGNSIRLKGSADRGAAYAVYDFLEYQVGCVFLTSKADYIQPADDLNIKDIDYTESPIFAIRDNYGNIPTLKYRDYAWSSANGIHTLASLAPDFCKQYENQPCLLDEAVYDQVIENVFKKLEAKPNSQIVSVSINDVASWCDCEKCTEAIEKESYTDYLLRFVNRVAEEIEKRGYKDVLVHTFAYAEAITAPEVVTPRSNVFIQFCPIHACIAHPLNANCNITAVGQFHGKYLSDWAKIDCKKYLWTYHGNFSNCPVPHTDISYATMSGSARFYVESGTIGWFAQINNRNPDVLGDFGALRNYLLSKFMWDPYMTEEEYDAHVNKFMRGYYGEGWKLIREVMDTVNEIDTGHHSLFGPVQDRIIYFTHKMDTPYLTGLFDKAELHAESVTEWKNIDRNQLSLDLMNVSLMWRSLNKTGNEEDALEAQYVAKWFQEKLLTYRVSYGSESDMFPNMVIGGFTDPANWRGDLDYGEKHGPGVQSYYSKIEDIDVEYPERPTDIMPLSCGIPR